MTADVLLWTATTSERYCEVEEAPGDGALGFRREGVAMNVTDTFGLTLRICAKRCRRHPHLRTRRHRREPG